MSNLKLYFIASDYFLRIAILLNKYYNKNSNVEDVDHDVMATLLDKTLNLKYNFFLELYQDIEEFTVKSADLDRKKNLSK